MAVLAQILVDFMFRLTFGIALAMALTSAKKVTAGFYRVHLWVLMGLNTFAAVAIYLSTDDAAQIPENAVHWAFWLAATMAAVSYIGAVVWLYELPKPGKLILLLVVGLSVVALLSGKPDRASQLSWWLDYGHLLSSGMLTGSIMTAMFLGHWYLNTPTMDLEPLRRLLLMVAVALALRCVFSATGLGLEWSTGDRTTSWWWFVVLRWTAGLVVIAALTVLTWQTLKIPNTQSATGILYAAVILVFIGELTAQLLSDDASFAL